jgi:hypothetical protein
VTALWGLAPLPGRRRKPDPTVVVHLVFADLTESVLPPDSPLARSIGQVADALSARPPAPSGRAGSARWNRGAVTRSSDDPLASTRGEGA